MSLVFIVEYIPESLIFDLVPRSCGVLDSALNAITYGSFLLRILLHRFGFAFHLISNPV